LIKLHKHIFFIPLFICLTAITSGCCLTRHFLYVNNPDISTLKKAPSGIETVSLHLKDGSTVEAWLKTTSSSEDPVLIFFYGNAQSLHGLYQKSIFSKFNSYHCHMISIDYPGYGNSEGPANDKRLIEAGEQCLKWVKNRFPNNPIIVSGWSLGSGVAVQVAKNDNNVCGLLLYSPYSSLKNAAKVNFWDPLVNLFLWDNFDSVADADKILCPSLIIHGKNDRIVPSSQGKMLSQQLKNCRFVEIDGTGHENIFDPQESRDALKDFISSINTKFAKSGE